MMTKERLAQLRYLRAEIKHLELSLDAAEAELGGLLAWIEDIEDSHVRQIFRLRYMCGLRWYQIATRIGGNTPDAVRMAHERYLQRTRAGAEGPTGARTGRGTAAAKPSAPGATGTPGEPGANAVVNQMPQRV